jgi:hypothetical protein
MKRIVGGGIAEKLRETSLSVYSKAREIAEQRGTIWKLILITSGVVLGTIGIFIFRQALLNIPVIGWVGRLIGL